MAYKFLFTDNQIVPSTSPDNLLHSMLVSCGEAKPEEEDGDVVQLITKVQVHSFQQISIHDSKQINHAYWVLDFINVEIFFKFSNYLFEGKTNSVVSQQIR